MLITGVLMFIGMIITHPYNPFSYLDIDQVISNEIQIHSWNSEFTLITCSMMTSIASIIFLLFSFVLFRFKAS